MYYYVEIIVQVPNDDDEVNCVDDLMRGIQNRLIDGTFDEACTDISSYIIVGGRADEFRMDIINGTFEKNIVNKIWEEAQKKIPVDIKIYRAGCLLARKYTAPTDDNGGAEVQNYQNSSQTTVL